MKTETLFGALEYHAKRSLLGDLLRHTISERGVTVAAAAEACGIAESTFRDYLSGRIGNPPQARLEALAELIALPVEIFDLFKARAPAMETKGQVVESEEPWLWYQWDLDEARDWLAENVDDAETEVEETPNFFAFRQRDPGDHEIRGNWIGQEEAPDEFDGTGRPVLLILFASGPNRGDVQSYKFYHGRDAEEQEEHEPEEASAEAEVETKSAPPEHGPVLAYVEGYASVWDVEDDYGDTVRRGAFTKTLANNPLVPLYWRHSHIFGSGLDTMPIGYVEAKEDSYGLFYRGPIVDTSGGRDLVALMRVMSFGSSIGFEIPEGGANQVGTKNRELVEIDLLEISVATYPALRVSSARLVEDSPEGTMTAAAERLAQIVHGG